MRIASLFGRLPGGECVQLAGPTVGIVEQIKMQKAIKVAGGKVAGKMLGKAAKGADEVQLAEVILFAEPSVVKFRV